MEESNTPCEDPSDQEGHNGDSEIRQRSLGSVNSRGSVLRHEDGRANHLRALWLKQKIQNDILTAPTRKISSLDNNTNEIKDVDYMQAEQEANRELENGNLSTRLESIIQLFDKYGIHNKFVELPLEVRMENFSYLVPLIQDEAKIKTVYNSSNVYKLVKWFEQVKAGRKLIGRKDKVGWKAVLQDINLVLQPGKMYLVLGPPGSGKSSLLKAITAHLHPGSYEQVQGKVLYNGKELDKMMRGRDLFIENAFAYIDQLDKHAPLLTVRETFDFAFQCKSGGKGMPGNDVLEDEQQRQAWEKADREGLIVQVVLDILGLSHVQDTFVGNNDIRGVSGGQRRRVTVGEMLVSRSPVLCGDEISTGLDAASTYDMVQILLHFGRHQHITRIISLLQPSPETVSLFDEVIVLAEGRIIYAGPIDQIEDYFANIGYTCPSYMDVADFVQMVSTEEGKQLWTPIPDSDFQILEAPSAEKLADIFTESYQGRHIQQSLQLSHKYIWRSDSTADDANATGVTIASFIQKRYANTFWRGSWLLIRKFFVLWKRDKRVITASIAKNILMGVAAGGVFRNVEDPVSLQGVLFQGGLFIMLTSMQNATALVNDRVVFYKQHTANFYSTCSFLIGRTVAGFPQIIMDVLLFGSLIFFLVGLSDRNVADFFIFVSLFAVFSVVMQQQLAVFASFSSASGVQVYSACTLLLMILFGGFIVSPVDVPDYFTWLYWWNPFAWCYRALTVLEFYSDRWDGQSETVLKFLGFIHPQNGNPYTEDWIAYGFLYMILYSFFCGFLSACFLSTVRNEGGVSVDLPTSVDDEETDELESEVSFKQADLSFRGICYDVNSSLNDGKDLRLLSDVAGLLRSGRMCALMGTSGAGKTTLMDLIALRKRTGTVAGEIFLNGWPQEEISFRRCSGYVYQFDVQSPQLTVRETVLFSARLRLDQKDTENEVRLVSLVDQVLRDVQLWSLKDIPVGYEDGVGLSFEQKKRLSIAVELVASPSIMFLDEPTSGLDAQSAMLVVKTLRKIADKGRTVCATVHQPSSSVFEMFDDLLLLRRGGEVIYHGPLGENSSIMVKYFESLGADKLNSGENPANWMLRVMEQTNIGDLHAMYKESNEFAQLQKEIEDLRASTVVESKIEFDSMYAVIPSRRRALVMSRLRSIYWRSPAYNLSRISTSCVIAVVLSAMFVSERTQQTYTESEMRSRLSVIFLSFIITGIMSMLAVLPAMTEIRDMFYRHKDASMYSAGDLNVGLAPVEIPFILLSTSTFVVIFLAGSGVGGGNLGSFIGFWGFFTFNSALYSYCGQAFVCLVKSLPTALILCGVYIGLNNFMAGLIVRPQLVIGTFFAFPYYIAPSHYVYEGMVVSLYHDDLRTVLAEPGTEYYEHLIDIGLCDGNADSLCAATTAEYISFFFGGNFVKSHIDRNAWLCGLFLVIARLATYAALAYIRHQ